MNETKLQKEKRERKYELFKEAYWSEYPHLIADGTLSLDYVKNMFLNQKDINGKKVYTKKDVNETFQRVKKKVADIREYR